MRYLRNSPNCLLLTSEATPQPVPFFLHIFQPCHHDCQANQRAESCGPCGMLWGPDSHAVSPEESQACRAGWLRKCGGQSRSCYYQQTLIVNYEIRKSQQLLSRCYVVNMLMTRNFSIFSLHTILSFKTTSGCSLKCKWLALSLCHASTKQGLTLLSFRDQKRAVPQGNRAIT